MRVLLNSGIKNGTGGESFELVGALKSSLRAAIEKKNIEIIAQPLLVMVDGATSSITEGTKVPIPLKTVSDSGTVSTTGYEYIQAGRSVTATLRETSSQTAMLSLAIEQTSIDGYIETAPITVGETFQTQVNIASAKVYLLGEMATTQKSKQHNGGLALAFETENQKSCTQIWCSVYRIATIKHP